MKTNYALVILAFLSSSTIFYDARLYQSRWHAMLIVLSCVYALWVGRKTHYTVGIAFLYTLIPVVFHMYQDAFFLRPIGKHIVDWSVTSATLCLLLVSFAVLQLDNFKWLFRVFGLYCLIDSIVVIGQYLYGIKIPPGLLIEHSMNGCFIAVTIPFLYSMLRGKFWALSVIPIIAIGLSYSTTSLIVFAAVFAALGYRKYKRFTIGILIFVFGFMIYRQGAGLFSSGDRIETIKTICSYIFHHALWLGEGNGVYYGKMPFAIGKNWLHPHSDLIRSIFSYGLAGTALWLAAFCVGLYKTYKDQFLFAAYIGMMAFITFQYPTFRSHDALLCASIFIGAFKIKNG